MPQLILASNVCTRQTKQFIQNTVGIDKVRIHRQRFFVFKIPQGANHMRLFFFFDDLICNSLCSLPFPESESCTLKINKCSMKNETKLLM